MANARSLAAVERTHLEIGALLFDTLTHTCLTNKKTNAYTLVRVSCLNLICPKSKVRFGK